MSEALTITKSSINLKLIEENRYGQNKKYSVFESPQNGSKQDSVAFMVQLNLITSKCKKLVQKLAEDFHL